MNVHWTPTATDYGSIVVISLKIMKKNKNMQQQNKKTKQKKTHAFSVFKYLASFET